MSDLRATERLLEVIGDAASERYSDPDNIDLQLRIITNAITELRRRGDTLVRARDLELVVRTAGEGSFEVTDEWEAARERLENTIGGTPR